MVIHVNYNSSSITVLNICTTAEPNETELSSISPWEYLFRFLPISWIFQSASDVCGQKIKIDSEKNGIPENQLMK
jgi:hypothetical protein